MPLLLLLLLLQWAVLLQSFFALLQSAGVTTNDGYPPAAVTTILIVSQLAVPLVVAGSSLRDLRNGVWDVLMERIRGAAAVPLADHVQEAVNQHRSTAKMVFKSRTAINEAVELAAFITPTSLRKVKSMSAASHHADGVPEKKDAHGFGGGGAHGHSGGGSSSGSGGGSGGGSGSGSGSGGGSGSVAAQRHPPGTTHGGGRDLDNGVDGVSNPLFVAPLPHAVHVDESHGSRDAVSTTAVSSGAGAAAAPQMPPPSLVTFSNPMFAEL